MKESIYVSVRSLVEYVYQSGSIVNTFRTTVSLTEGTKAHQKIQSTYEESDVKERHTQGKIEFQDYLFQIEGRCDGLLLKNNQYIVEEIKSTMRNLDDIKDSTHPVHWAQAKVYGYLLCEELNLETIAIQLTYVSVETEEKKHFYLTFTKEELNQYIFELLTVYYPYAKWKYEHIEQRNQSIQDLNFPFPSFRKGQRKLAGAVYQTIQEGNNLFAVAPTGIGKTISTIFPTVKAIGENKFIRLFYLTSKTITRTVAEEAFQRMSGNGLTFLCVTLTAKDKICFKEETICDKDYCEFADGYYDRINEAVLDILSNEQRLTKEKIEQYARKHMVCPFEFSLDLTNNADAIICDINYIFDPRASLKRLFDEQKRSSVLLIDEAHNLVDRAREMYSANLLKSRYLDLKRGYKGVNAQIYSIASEVNQSLIEIRKKFKENPYPVWNELDEELVQKLEAFIEAAEIQLQIEENVELKQLLLDTFFEAQSYVKIANLYDENFVSYVEQEKSEVNVKLFCVDPSKIINDIIKRFHSTVYFSATMTPLQYFIDMLGDPERDYTIKVDSPFKKEQLDVGIYPISTRFNDREKTLHRIATSIFENIMSKKANYLVFFPSYKYLLQFAEYFFENYPDIKTIVQDVGMSENEREEFLEKFSSDNKETLVGFAVLGGIFSEGIDLKGDRLNGVVIVGVGLPQICLERNILKNQFDAFGKNGYYYAYVFPGMNKVLQAAGRLIRSEEDTGTLLLIDDRYKSSLYQSLMPDEWK